MNADNSQTCVSCGRVSVLGYQLCPWCGAALPQKITGGTLRAGAKIDFGWAVAVLGQQLGEGGMGVVYYASLHASQSNAGVQPPVEAAIKILHATFSQQGRVRDLFTNEARILASLAHPSVVRFYGIVDVGSTSAIAMEFVRGENLATLIERKAKEAAVKQAKSPGVRVLPCLTFDRAWHYFQQLLGALAATHAIGIVHRDVKPDNVLLRVDGVAKLTDFGIARIPQSISAATGNMIAGTVAYMSPEQIQGKALDGRSDLYSAGCVLFELLTGRLPFPVEDRSDWLVACDHVQTPPPRLRQFLPQAPMELEMLLTRALAKDPADRFQSAVSFGDAFRLTLGIKPDVGWQAQQAMAAEVKRFATSMQLGKAVPETPELQQARNAVATAYVRG